MDNNYRADMERRGGYMCGNYYCMSHVIRKGDTLYRLSREYGVKVSALMMANPFVDIYNLRVGDELCIPRLRSGEQAPAPMPAAEPAAAPVPMAEPAPAAMPGISYNENDRVIDAEMQMDGNRNDMGPGMMDNRMVNDDVMEDDRERVNRRSENWNSDRNRMQVQGESRNRYHQECQECGHMGYSK